MHQDDKDFALWKRLTEKQRDCLDLLVQRKTSKQIARILDISKPTVDQRITAARTILGTADRDETALLYAHLKAAYDRIIYDPVDLPLRPELVPSNFPDGDPETLFSLRDSRWSSENGDGYRGAFLPSGGLWRHDLEPRQRIVMYTAILVAIAIVLLAGISIAQTLSVLFSG